MAEFPVISIVTPSYNQGDFLEETLASVLSQEGDFQLDYFVVDGGSSDGSVPLLRRYAERIEAGDWPVRCRGIRFRWLSEKDRGQTDALTKGFRMAEGEILGWLNSDDLYLPGTLQAAANAFRADPETALLYGDADYCDAQGRVIGRYPTEAFDFRKLAWFNFLCQPSTFFRRAAFDAVGGLDETLQFAMDYDLFVRLGKRFPVRYLPRTLSMYRLHEASKTVSGDVLLRNEEEALHLALKHFGWAPLNRVYGACHAGCLSRSPGFLGKFPLLATGAALLCTLPRSLRLNRGCRREDLKLLTRDNFRKLFRTRLDILRG